MKKKIFSIGMIVVLVLSSMLLMATPASAGTLAWSNQVLFGQNQVVAPGANVNIVRVAPNGDVFAVSGLNIYKSLDGGRTYGNAVNIGGASYIADLQVSPAYETDNTVVVLADNAAGDAQVYISTNGGSVFGALGAALNPGVPAEMGTSLSIAPNYIGGYGGLIAGTATGAGGGDFYEYTMAGWITPLSGALGEDVRACAYSPNYPIDATILVVSTDGINTFLHTKVASATWDNNIYVGGVPGTPVTIVDDVGPFAAVSADIAMPSDFNGSLAFNRTVYVAAIGGVSDKAYRITAGGTSSPLNFNTLNDGPPPATGDDEASSIAYSGTQTAGTLYVGANGPAAQVYRSTNAYPTAPAVLISFTGALPAPSGAAATKVALAADYASSNTVYAGTSGAEAAFSVSNNGGAAFYQAGLINTTIASITDFQAVSATELFMVTEDGGGGLESIWKTEDGGLSWYRISTFASTLNNVIIRPSPDFATDGTLYLADVGGTAMMLSNDGGDTWTPRTAQANIGDIAVKDMYTIYVGCADNNVYSSFNGGFFFSLGMGVGAPVYDIEIDLGTGNILCGLANGGVSISTDGSTFNNVGLATPFTANNITVAFDANYADNHFIYAADTAAALGTAGVWRVAYTPGPPVVWPTAALDGGVCLIPADILVAPDGTLYASDATPAALGPAVGGIVRILDPAAVPAPTMTERVAMSSAPPVAPTDDGLPLGDTLTGLTMAEGSNIIWAIDNLGGIPPVSLVRTYTDTLSTAAPMQVSPANGTVFAGATSATFIWDAITGASSYRVRYNTRSDFLPATTILSNAVNSPLTSVVTNAANFPLYTPLIPGMTYYWQVQVISPVLGPWSEVWSFKTQLTPGGVNAPGIIPATGGVGNTGPGGTQVALMPTFQWGTVPGATGYEFELATDAGMSNVIISETLMETAYQATTALDYDTVYYWRVRAVSAASETEWSPVTAFTTMSQPAPTGGEGGGTTVIVPTQPAPSIVIPTQPAPIITVTTGEEGGVAPGYIWAVIIIGAVLVIALIVLIVRTRRTV